MKIKLTMYFLRSLLMVLIEVAGFFFSTKKANPKITLIGHMSTWARGDRLPGVIKINADIYSNH